MSDEMIGLTEDAGSEIRRPLRGRPPNTAKLSNQMDMSNDEDSRSRAARIAEQIRAQREGREDDGIDEFKAPAAPPGFAYQWKRKEVMGKEDFSHQNNLIRNGWAPVPASRHPDFMPLGMTGANIEHKGMVLMELPEELVTDARKMDKRRADIQVNQKAAQLEGKSNTLLDSQTEKTARKLTRSFSPIAIPD